ncbi:MAG: hypothetical protein BWY79_01472 [Actinobacteria bacterium ADurb.Bin444]|nr:MAG: hypothetical protein BWY79_01472 [Actinobacteria bacterium ADurb.Bin444]
MENGTLLGCHHDGHRIPSAERHGRIVACGLSCLRYRHSRDLSPRWRVKLVSQRRSTEDVVGQLLFRSVLHNGFCQPRGPTHADPARRVDAGICPSPRSCMCLEDLGRLHRPRIQSQPAGVPSRSQSRGQPLHQCWTVRPNRHKMMGGCHQAFTRPACSTRARNEWRVIQAVEHRPHRGIGMETYPGQPVQHFRLIPKRKVLPFRPQPLHERSGSHSRHHAGRSTVDAGRPTANRPISYQGNAVPIQVNCPRRSHQLVPLGVGGDGLEVFAQQRVQVIYQIIL